MSNDIRNHKVFVNNQGFRRNHIKVPSDFSSRTVTTSTQKIKLTLPNDSTYGGNGELKFHFTADSTASAVNAILTVTSSDTLATGGGILIVWTDPFTGKTDATDQLIFSSDAAAIKAAIEALPSFRGTITASAAFSAGTSVTFTFSGEYAGIPIPATSLKVMSSNTNDTLVTSVTTAGNGICVDRNAFALLESVKITWAGKVIYDLSDAGRYFILNCLQKMDKSELAHKGPMFGANRLDKLYLEAAAGVDYHLPLYKVVDFLGQTLPLHMSKYPLVLEIQFQTAAKSLYSAGSSAGLTYTVADIEFHYDTLEGKKSTEQGLIPYVKVYHQQENLSANSTTLNHKINLTSKSLRAVYGMLRTSSSVDDSSVLGKQDTYEFSSPTSYYFKFNGRNVPQENVVCDNGSVEAFKHFINCDDSPKRPTITLEQYKGDSNTYLDDVSGLVSGDKFVIGYSFLPRHARGRMVKTLNGGINLSASSGTHSLVLNKTAVNTLYQFDSYFEVDAVVSIGSSQIDVSD